MFNGGGFGGDAGNQFAGGGFMPSQAPQHDTFGAGASGGGRGSKQTLRTLTIRQMWQAAQRDDEMFSVDGVELSNVRVLGRITNVRDANQKVTLTITDGTGIVEVDHWLNGDPNMIAQQRAEWQPGVYVSADGHLRRHDGNISINGFSVRTVTDFDKVTHHFLRAIFEHLHFTKGGASQGMNAPSGMVAAAPVGGAAPWQGGGAQQATAYAGAAGAGIGGCATAALQIISASNSDMGVHRTEVYGKLRGQYNQADIDNALQQLQNEAHVYTTMDDDHFRPA